MIVTGYKTCWIIALCFCVQISFAQSTSVFTPVTDGIVYSTGATQTDIFLALGTTTQGILKFRAFDSTPYQSIALVLSPYGLPIVDNMVGIYGFGSSDSIIRGSDYNVGSYLGTMMIPPDATWGQLVSFDVTSFVRSSSMAFLGFDLRSGGTVLSSLEYNYGIPPELAAFSLPEPDPMVLVLIAGGLFGLLLAKSLTSLRKDRAPR